jgi:TonB family protein
LFALLHPPSLERSMSLRCFVFSSDGGASDVIRQVLTGLDVEGESCPDATTAVERVAHEPFHLVILDWDQQPEAGMILGATRERKPAERPLTLAIVSDDQSVPKALQAGANSILRKPLVASQVMDTLTTARDLIRSRQNATKPAQAAPTAASSASVEAASENHLRAGEFLQSAPLNPGGQYVTESDAAGSPNQSSEPIDSLKELETVAAAAPPPLPEPDEPKGLEWYLKKNGINRGAAAASAPAPVPAQKSGAELLGYDQTPSHGSGTADKKQSSEASHQKEPALFSSYIEEKESAGPKTSSPSRLRTLKGPIIGALALAACAVVAAPQAPWHPHMKVLIARGQRSLHAWLNPVATPAVTQAPVTHEDFARAGDEYKLPVAENIPDATTDPSQIQVLPVVDPTAKKPAGDAPAPEVNTDPKDPSATTPSPDASQPSGVAVPENPPVQPAPPAAVPSTSPAPVASAPASTGTAVVTTAPVRTDPPAVATAPVSSPVPSTPPPPRRQPAPYVPVTTKVPSSLQSQMAVMVPDASGNKPADAAMPSIEPVDVPELTERNLLAEQPPMGYPATAKGQQGTVILQVLVGRDGVVQDAKFLQGSLAFARTAIDGVRQWKFKPYIMNGRPVSVQTLLTVKFKPGQ